MVPQTMKPAQPPEEPLFAPKCGSQEILPLPDARLHSFNSALSLRPLLFSFPCTVCILSARQDEVGSGKALSARLRVWDGSCRNGSPGMPGTPQTPDAGQCVAHRDLCSVHLVG